MTIMQYLSMQPLTLLCFHPRAMMHYLTEVHGLSLQTLDKDRQSPLHISCQHGHQEAVVYLLKKEVGLVDGI